MLARELAHHARHLTISNKRVISANAGLQQYQHDTFLFHRKQLQDFEKSNRTALLFTVGQTYGFFQQMFLWTRTVMFSYEKKSRNQERRLELIISNERDMSDINLTILNRKAQHQQQLIQQYQNSRNPGVVVSSSTTLNMMSSSNANSRNTLNHSNSNNTIDPNLRALPEFKRPDLSQTPIEMLLRDELLQRRILQDLFIDWISSTMNTLTKRSTVMRLK